MADFREYDRGPLGEKVGPLGIILKSQDPWLLLYTEINIYFQCIPAHFDSSCAHGMITILKARVAMLEPNLAQQNSHKRLSSVSEKWVV